MKLVRLREWRTKRGLSQAELGGAAGVERAMISKFETGRREAQPATARRLAAALDVSPEELIYSADMEPPPWGRATGAALDTAKERGELTALLERFESEAEGPARSMYEVYRREAEFSEALRGLDVSRLPARSASLLLGYAQVVGSFLEAGVKVPAGLGRGVAEVLDRETRKEGGPE